MTASRSRSYNTCVTMLRWQRAGMLLLVFALAMLMRGVARAQVSHVAVGPSPMLFVEMQDGRLAIHTWNQPQIAIDADPSVQFKRVAGSAATRLFPEQIMLWSQTIHTSGGDMMLAPEPFVLPDLTNAPHDAVIVHGQGNAVITVPAGTALIVSDLREGRLRIDGYRSGAFVAHVGAGSVQLENDGGTGAVQVNSGPVFVSHSTFVRLRVRTARGNMLFEQCSVDEIEATSLMGSIIYDNGRFAPGLARFESEQGDIALGVLGGVEIGAHSSAGKIYSNLPGIPAGSTDVHQMIGGGGPVITATSGTGAVIFYNGALRDHPELQARLSQRFRRRFPPGDLPQWRPL